MRLLHRPRPSRIEKHIQRITRPREDGGHDRVGQRRVLCLAMDPQIPGAVAVINGIAVLMFGY
jgi:hypothetical protein